VAGALVSLAGFYLMQRGIYQGRVSVAVSIISALSIVTTFALSTVIFNQPITYLKWFGAITIILGIIELMKDADK
jgi:multidrug transporter EmrE-like cation transporter